MHGPETRYTEAEKFVLVLVHAARKLRSYFQGHPITIVTDQPLRPILSKPEISGRMAKWAIELAEHDISFQPRTAIKVQALADFIVEGVSLSASEAVGTSIEQPSSQGSPPRQDSTSGQGCSAWTLYVDGASSREGSGAGLLLLSPGAEELTYTLRFDFPASNNEAEYEALITGIELAQRCGTSSLRVFSDSQLIVNQVLGTYEAKEDPMKKYLARVTELKSQFGTFEIQQIPRSQNKRADALSKLASSSFFHLNKKVLVEVVKQRGYEKHRQLPCQVGTITEQTSWMSPIVKYLSMGELPAEKTEARKLRLRAGRYVLHQGVLYRRSYLAPWLKCITLAERGYVLREIHEEICGNHIGPRVMAKKCILAGYYWPTIFLDSAELYKKCAACQVYTTVQHLPAHEMILILSPWPFAQWGIDLLGPFPKALGGLEFLVVAIDYFTKWIEAEPLSTISGRTIQKFFWKNIICRFGIPHCLISYNGKQFAENPFKDWCTELGIR